MTTDYSHRSYHRQDQPPGRPIKRLQPFEDAAGHDARAATEEGRRPRRPEKAASLPVAWHVLHDCERVDLDEVARAEQSAHLNRRAGWWRGSIDVPVADLADHGQDRHVGHVDAELDDVGERRSGSRKGEAQVLEDAFGARAKAAGILARLVESGALGAKSGRGFWIHGTRRPKPNAADLGVEERRAPQDAEIADRLLLGMVCEASRCLAERVVNEPSHLDLGTVLGAGFPPFLGGVRRYAQSLGEAVVRHRLDRLVRTYGPRFAPPESLAEIFRRTVVLPLRPFDLQELLDPSAALSGGEEEEGEEDGASAACETGPCRALTVCQAIDCDAGIPGLASLKNFGDARSTSDGTRPSKRSSSI